MFMPYQVRKLLLAGILLVSVLLAALVALWAGSAYDHNVQLQHQATEQLKTRFIAHIRDLQQQRTISILKVLSSGSQADRERELQHYHAIGLEYATTRDRLFALPFTDAEIQRWQHIRTIMLANERNQLTIEQLIIQESDIARARVISDEKLLPALDLLNEHISAVLDYQRRQIESEIHDSLARKDLTTVILLTVSLIASMLGVFALLLVNRSAQTQHNLVSKVDILRDILDILTAPGISYSAQITALLKLGCHVLETDAGTVCRIDQEDNLNESVHVYSNYDTEIRPGIVRPLDKTFCQLILETDNVIAISNAGSTKYRGHAFYRSTGINTYIAAPLIIDGKQFGSVNFFSIHARAEEFTPIHIEIIQLLSTCVAIALSQQRLQQDLIHDKENAVNTNISKSIFLRNVSREIRTPLNAIIGYAELLAEEAKDLDNQSNYRDLARITDSGHQLMSIINDVIDLTNIEAGQTAPVLQDIEFETFIKDIIASFKPLLASQNNILSIDIREPNLVVQADSRYLYKIVSSLLEIANNSTKAGKLKFSVYLSFVRRQWAIFEVTDSSAGLTQEQMDNIFVAFSPINVQISQGLSGTGLGLTISKQYAKMMGGDIDVQSVVGEGSTFSFRLPHRATTTEGDTPRQD